MEPDRSTRWIREVVDIRKEGRRSMNRDEGSYTPSNAYNVASLPWQEPKEELNKLLLVKVSDRARKLTVN